MTTLNGIAVIFAGGVGSRMHGAKVPKQFLCLGGRPIIAHTLKRFEEAPSIDGVFVVCIETWIDELKRVVAEEPLTKIKAIVPGGNSGQESIFCGLESAHNSGLVGEDTVVLIHDGVRPLIDADTINRCVKSVREKGPTATVSDAVETVIRLEGDQVADVYDRSTCKLARAPQGFIFDELYAAHLRAQAEGKSDFIDSVSLMSYYGHPIYTVDGPSENIKITTQQDFFAFKGFVDSRELSQLWQ